VKRGQLAQDLPNVCKCGKRTKSAAGLANHMRSKSCLERMTTKSNKFSKLFTPAKTSSVKKQRSKRRKAMSAEHMHAVDQCIVVNKLVLMQAILDTTRNAGVVLVE
jgi:hypothetical protein